MKPELQEQETKKCADSSCGCGKKEKGSSLNLAKEFTAKNKEDDKTLDPTHFGDWQVNCRAVDF